MANLYWSCRTEETATGPHGFRYPRRHSGHLRVPLRTGRRVPPLSVVRIPFIFIFVFPTLFALPIFQSVLFHFSSALILAVSDDNSSIQSSPWQRDHCWKQANPRRCISTEFNLYYRRDPRNRLCAHPRLVARKRRRPLDPTIFQLVCQESTMNYHENASSLKGRKSNNVGGSGKALSLIIDKLARLLDSNVVSPRKRILRELERVTLEDQASKRRATPQPINPTTAPVPSPKQLSSYSITSILGEDKPNPEPGFLRNLLKLEDGQAVKYSSSHSYPRTRVDPYVASANTSIHHPLYGVPMLPPGPYRAPLWMHYPPPVHYPPPMPIYAPPPLHPSSPPVHHYKDYREQALTPPSGTPQSSSSTSPHSWKKSLPFFYVLRFLRSVIYFCAL